MNNPASLQSRDIVTVKQQIVDGQEIKNRMWVVISKNILHQSSNGCILLAITTNPTTSSYMMKIEAKDLEYGKLAKPFESKVIIDKPVWTKLVDVNGVVGKVTSQFYDDLKNKIRYDVLEI